MAILKIKQPNGSWAIVGGTSDAIKFTEQQLTEEQKQVARENIGASSVGKPGTGEGAEIFNNYAKNEASEEYSHAEGFNTKASGRCSHTEGSVTVTRGFTAHAEGWGTYADHDYSHAGGYSTQTSAKYQTVIGKYNSSGLYGSLFIVGCGESDEERSNAFEVSANGLARLPKADDFSLHNLGQTNVIIKAHLDEALANFKDELPSFYINITYNELKELRNSGKLIPGAFYKIIDYECTTTQSGTRAINNNLFSIVVQALDVNMLSEIGYAIKNDKLNVSIRYKIPGVQYGDTYDIHDISEQTNNEGNLVPIIRFYNYHDIAYYVDRYELDGVLYDRWRIIEGEQDNDIFYDWDFDSKKYLLTNVVTENAQFTIQDSAEIIQYGVIYDDIDSIYDEQKLEGNKDVIVEANYITDAQGNSIPVLYKNDEEDFPGQVDYEDEYRYIGRQMLGDEEYDAWYCGYGTFYSYMLTDIMVDDNGQFLSDISIGTAESAVWDIKYCLDNDITRFAWADEENGKGVIYYMKDEQNNECPYDFKNIQFIRPIINGCQYSEENGEDTWVYTFSAYDSELKQLLDASSIDLQNANGEHVFFCLNNSIKDYFGPSDTGFLTSRTLFLNNIVFLGGIATDNPVYYRCVGNQFDYDCSSNTLEGDCCYNVFGRYCRDNILGWSCSLNVFGNYCQTNRLAEGCLNNSLNIGSRQINLGHGCAHNRFGQYCLACDMTSNCSDITFEAHCSLVSIKINFAQYIKIGAGCTYINLINNEIGNRTNQVENITCCQGVRGTSAQPLDLYVQRNAAPVVYEAPGTTHIILD